MSGNLIREVDVQSFRAFDSFRLHGLGYVNLLVGRNNSGKSSLLEAVQIASSYGDPYSLLLPMARRGEQVLDEGEGIITAEADVSHLFHGHTIEPGTDFVIRLMRETSAEILEAAVYDSSEVDDNQPSLFELEELVTPLVLSLKWTAGQTSEVSVPLSRRGGLSPTALRRSYRMRPLRRPIQLVTTAALSAPEVVALFEEIVLTPDENRVVEALKTIEPSIERIATVATSRRRTTDMDRGGVVVKCSGVEQRIPIGSMGDGIWRMLGLALALIRSENGILLVDEIDTGLHYTVMEDMWRLIYQNAIRLNVQVFATTHSRDCYESLAAIVGADQTDQARNDVTIQRIERAKKSAVVFSDREIWVAAERAIEVR